MRCFFLTLTHVGVFLCSNTGVPTVSGYTSGSYTNNKMEVVFLDLQQTLQIITLIISIITFIGSIGIFLFKKIVIDPLQRAIDMLNSTLTRFEKSTNRQLNLLDKEIDLLKLKTTRHDEQIKTLFNDKGVM